MRIMRLKLGGFGSFNDGIDVDFGDQKLVVLIGRNEAGKSTLMSAVFGVLFGFKDASLQKKFEPWDTHDTYSGEVEIETEKRQRVLIRRDFRDNTAEIIEVGADGGASRSVFLGSANPRGHTDEDIDYYKRIESIVGFQDEAVFRCTVFMGQSALEMSITDQVRRLVSGSTSTDFKGVLHDLHYRFSELTKENPWRKGGKSRPREIEILEAEVSEKTRRLEQAREVFMRSVALDQEVKRIEKLQEDNKIALEGHRRTLALIERFGKLVKDRDASRERFREVAKRRQTYEDLKGQIRGIDEEVKNQLRPFARLGDNFPDLVAQLKAHHRELDAEQDALDRERETLKHLKPVPNNRLGAILAVLGVAAGLTFLMQGKTGLGLGVAAALGTSLFFVGRMLGTGFKQRLDELQAGIRTRERALAGRESAIQDVIATSGGLLGKDDPDKLLSSFKRCRTLAEDRNRKLSAMTVLGDAAEIEATYERTAEENLKCNAMMDIVLRDAPYLSDLSENPVELVRHMEELKKRISDLATQVDVTAEVLTQARIEQAKVSVDVDADIAELEDDVEKRSRRLDRLVLEKDALKVVIETLEECVNEFQEGDLNALSNEVSEIFRRITNNRYTRVTLSPNMEPMLTKYDSTHIAPTDLSQGTQDQLYFAMRVAIARHLSRKVALPFFLDDPFVNFDQDRLNVTRDVLDSFDDHQVLFVTCNREYERWSSEILDLDRSRAEAVASGQPRLELSPTATSA